MDNIRNEYFEGRFEQTEDGIYFPRSRMLAQGVFSVNKRGEPVEYSRNLVVDEGLNYLLSAAVIGGGIANWYIALYSGNVTVLSSWTSANFDANATEWVAYTQPGGVTHPLWDKGAVSSGAADSFSAKAEFTSTADTQVVYGAALMSGATRPTPAAGGTLIAASNFPSVKNLDTDEVLDVGYGLTLTAV